MTTGKVFYFNIFTVKTLVEGSQGNLKLRFRSSFQPFLDVWAFLHPLGQS